MKVDYQPLSKTSWLELFREVDLNDHSSIWRILADRLRSPWAFLLMACAALVAAVLSEIDPLVASVLWALTLIVALVRAGGRSHNETVPERLERTAEQPARDATPLARSLIAALDQPILILRADGNIAAQNPAAEKAFGMIAANLHISTRFRSPGILDMVRETIATGEPNQIEHSERLPSERVYVVRVAQAELPADEAPQPPLYLLSFRDISELRRLERMRSDFVANASHELRTPLASLRGFLETLMGPAKNDAKAHERFFGIMLEQANRMSRLVDDLLSLSRLELKAHIAPDETVDLVPMLGHVRDSLAPLASDLGVEIRLHMLQSKVEVTGDRDELVQVFENLIENACKYGQDGETVDVYVRNEDGQPVEVSIVDHGPGIPAEHLPRLTERFYRVSVTDSRSKKGTGLGLAIVKHILTRHRARLVVKSEEGKGAEFTVRF